MTDGRADDDADDDNDDGRTDNDDNDRQTDERTDRHRRRRTDDDADGQLVGRSVSWVGRSVGLGQSVSRVGSVGRSGRLVGLGRVRSGRVGAVGWSIHLSYLSEVNRYTNR